MMYRIGILSSRKHNNDYTIYVVELIRKNILTYVKYVEYLKPIMQRLNHCKDNESQMLISGITFTFESSLIILVLELNHFCHSRLSVWPIENIRRYEIAYWLSVGKQENKSSSTFEY